MFRGTGGWCCFTSMGVVPRGTSCTTPVSSTIVEDIVMEQEKKTEGRAEGHKAQRRTVLKGEQLIKRGV